MRKVAYIGWDPREVEAFGIAKRSMLKHLRANIPVLKLSLARLMALDYYYRKTIYEHDKMFDLASRTDTYDGSMSTEHACARFWVPWLERDGLALFTDGDILVRADVYELFRIAEADPSKAVWVVKHNYVPEKEWKKSQDKQARYARKNWSSVCLWNCDHPANRKIDLEMLNTLPGRDLHAFCWLEDDEIGALNPEWNWLVNFSNPNMYPAIVHYTEGCPNVKGHENDPYADEWRSYLTANADMVDFPATV